MLHPLCIQLSADINGLAIRGLNAVMMMDCFFIQRLLYTVDTAARIERNRPVHH
jgi:hypothetical protein